MPTRQDGFSYVIALLFVAVLSILSLRAVEGLATNGAREREARLLSVGEAYRLAIRSYYEGSPGTYKTYPPDLAALLHDPRTSTLRRHLRKLYPDPITGGDDWGIVPAAAGGIMGVFSKSERKPIKSAGFPHALAAFGSTKTYQEWRFIYQPGS